MRKKAGRSSLEFAIAHEICMDRRDSGCTNAGKQAWRAVCALLHCQLQPCNLVSAGDSGGKPSAPADIGFERYHKVVLIQLNFSYFT
jgi:hypothetical protein